MQSLYVKYRPSKFEDVIGQYVTVKILQKQVFVTVKLPKS